MKEKLQYSKPFIQGCIIEAFLVQAHQTQNLVIIDFVTKVSEDLLKTLIHE